MDNVVIAALEPEPQRNPASHHLLAIARPEAVCVLPWYRIAVPLRAAATVRDGNCCEGATDRAGPGHRNGGSAPPGKRRAPASQVEEGGWIRPRASRRRDGVRRRARSAPPRPA